MCLRFRAFSFDVAFAVTTPFAVPVDRSPFSSIVAAALPDFVVTDHVTPLLIASAGVTRHFHLAASIRLCLLLSFRLQMLPTFPRRFCIQYVKRVYFISACRMHFSRPSPELLTVWIPYSSVLSLCSSVENILPVF